MKPLTWSAYGGLLIAIALPLARALPLDSPNISIRNLLANDAIVYDKLISGKSGEIGDFIYNREYRGRLCLFSCEFYDGAISRWTNLYVDLELYQSTCSGFPGGCKTMIYPQPKEKIVLVIGGQEHDMKLISLKLNRYYIPLAARKLIAANPQQKVIIRTGWDQYPEYILSKAFVKMLGGLLDTSAEQSPAYVGSLPTRSKSERLREIDELLESGAITESEHGQARKAILLD